MRLASALVVLGLLGCTAQPAPPPTTVAPTATPAPTAAAAVSAPGSVAAATPASALDVGEDANDVFEEILNNVLDATDEAAAMSDAPCDELQTALKENPSVFKSVQGFGATLKRAIAAQPDMADDEELQSALADLDVALSELNGALSLCGISQT
jgi:hypothetical protein